jgi:hypothetical protein
MVSREQKIELHAAFCFQDRAELLNKRLGEGQLLVSQPFFISAFPLFSILAFTSKGSTFHRDHENGL